MFVTNTKVPYRRNQFLTLLEKGHLHGNIGLTMDPCGRVEFSIPSTIKFYLKKQRILYLRDKIQTSSIAKPKIYTFNSSCMQIA